MVARQMHERGKRCHWYDLVFRPRLAFLKSFIFKRGFLDGTWGLLVAQKSAVSTQLKYAALWAVQNSCAEPRAGSASGPEAGPSDSQIRK
jgi:(heptosyl)LPS beta-1,4-glucosyltransferase